MPFSAPVLTYRAKGLASNIQSKVLKVHNTLININITAISAPEMTYTPSNMSHTKNKSKKDSMNALANMGANMSAMLSGNSPLTES